MPVPERVGLAVSGGPDSLALLLLAHAVLPGSFEVATVDHGLRPESAGEAAHVGSIAEAQGIRHTVLRLDLELGPALQERARAARYRALGAWARVAGLAAVVTAHHVEDQAETLLMRLARGAGVRGLAAMRAASPLPEWPELGLLRPLLGWRRTELAKVVTAAGIEAIDDPSNWDARFERVRFREMLAATPSLDPSALAASAHHLAEADAAIEWAAERSLASTEVHVGVLQWTPADTPRAVGLRVLERIVMELSGGKPRGSALARWHGRLSAGEVATLAGVRGDGRKSAWCFTTAPDPRHHQKERAERP
ncbi:tRNA lysidine(34) synthetase TilS [Novosphingobium sp. PASSN1]|uniref:tRNA lysidine(34) synthetase TilS n=1 Tax=Novosphingobium sp. PASSN1 TaxID=2015561 RepID=UPI0025D56F77|nr:tRNA lysidine(34) synthetase TilS [Novosphingobium sp. PASSN1]